MQTNYAESLPPFFPLGIFMFFPTTVIQKQFLSLVKSIAIADLTSDHSEATD